MTPPARVLTSWAVIVLCIGVVVWRAQMWRGADVAAPLVASTVGHPAADLPDRSRGTRHALLVSGLLRQSPQTLARRTLEMADQARLVVASWTTSTEADGLARLQLMARADEAELAEFVARLDADPMTASIRRLRASPGGDGRLDIDMELEWRLPRWTR
jgi:hypothetical protein